MKRWLLAFLLLAGCVTHLWAAGWADRWPRSGQAVFDVRLDGGLLIARNRQSWQHDGKHWQLRSATEPGGVATLLPRVHAVQESRGIFLPGGLQPVEYRTEKNGKLKDRAVFDLAARRVGFREGDPAHLTGQTQDQLSLFYQLGALDPGLSQATLMMTTGRKLHAYLVRHVASGEISTALGERRLRHLEITRVGGGDGGGDLTEVWLDEETRLPFRIRYRDRKGRVFDQALVTLDLGTPQ